MTSNGVPSFVALSLLFFNIYITVPGRYFHLVNRYRLAVKFRRLYQYGKIYNYFYLFECSTVVSYTTCFNPDLILNCNFNPPSTTIHLQQPPQSSPSTKPSPNHKLALTSAPPPAASVELRPCSPPSTPPPP